MRPATIEIVKDANTLSEEAKSRLDKYLNGFLEPQFRHDKDDEPNTIVCPACRSHIYAGGLMDAMFSTFEWGIVHGDGFCGKCRWPIRMYHFVRLDGDDEQRLVFPLAYRCYRDDACEQETDPATYWNERNEQDA